MLIPRSEGLHGPQPNSPASPSHTHTGPVRLVRLHGEETRILCLTRKENTQRALRGTHTQQRIPSALTGKRPGQLDWDHSRTFMHRAHGASDKHTCVHKCTSSDTGNGSAALQVSFTSSSGSHCPPMKANTPISAALGPAGPSVQQLIRGNFLHNHPCLPLL